MFLTTNLYDSLNRLQRSVDNIGQTFDYRYDSRDNLVAMADAQGPLTGASISRRTFSSEVLTVNDFGNVTIYSYDGINRQTRQDIILTAAGDGDGVNIGATLEGVETTTPTPDPAQGGGDGIILVGYTYDQNSLLSSLVDDQGNVTLYLYDNLNRRVAETKGLTAVSVLVDIGTSTGTNSPTTLNDLGKSWTVDEWAGRTVKIAAGTGAGQKRHVESNTATQLVISEDWDTIPDATSQYAIDIILGPREIVTPTAATIADPAVIPADKIANQLLDAKTRLDAVASLFPPLADRVDDMPPTTIVYGYAPDDNVLILEDENDNEVFTNYDAINRSIHVRVYRAGQSDDHCADPDFAPCPVSDPSNPTDPANPPVVVGTNAHDYQYDGLSRMTRATDNNEPWDPISFSDDSIITYAYDSLSRVLEETQQIIGWKPAPNPPKVISSAWRAENLRSGLAYPNDRQLDYTYDGLDRLNTVADEGAAQDIADYDYIGSWRVAERSYPINRTRMTYLNDAGDADVGYDGLRRPVQLRHLRLDSSLVVGFTHTYDRMNNKLNEVKLHDAANSEAYDYDSAYRLVQFDRPGVGAITPLHSEWTLDGVGNWQQVDGETRQHSSFNELIHVEDGSPFNLDYDDNGNLTDDGTYEFAWDYRNRLRTVTRKAGGALIAVHAYDADDRRIRKVVTNSGALNGTTDYYYDGWQVLEERDGGDVLTQQYVYGRYIDEPLALDKNEDGDGSATGPDDNRLFYHQNSLYSMFAVTDASADHT